MLLSAVSKEGGQQEKVGKKVVLYKSQPRAAQAGRALLLINHIRSCSPCSLLATLMITGKNFKK